LKNFTTWRETTFGCPPRSRLGVFHFDATRRRASRRDFFQEARAAARASAAQGLRATEPVNFRINVLFAIFLVCPVTFIEAAERPILVNLDYLRGEPFLPLLVGSFSFR